MAKKPTAAAIQAGLHIIEALELRMDREELMLLASLIDPEFEEAMETLQEVWEDFSAKGELKVSTVMRMQSVLAYMQHGEEGLSDLFNETSGQ